MIWAHMIKTELTEKKEIKKFKWQEITYKKQLNRENLIYRKYVSLRLIAPIKQNRIYSEK